MKYNTYFLFHPAQLKPILLSNHRVRLNGSIHIFIPVVVYGCVYTHVLKMPLENMLFNNHKYLKNVSICCFDTKHFIDASNAQSLWKRKEELKLPQGILDLYT